MSRARRLISIALVGAALGAGVSSVALADGSQQIATCLRSAVEAESPCPGRPVVDFGGAIGVRPDSRGFAPASLRLRGKVSTDNGTPPPSLREVTIDLGQNIRVDARGLPVCDGPTHAVRRPPGARICDGATVVGSGRIQVEVAFPGTSPILLASELELYNDGVADGVTTLVAIANVDVPAPTDIAIPIEIARAGGAHGLRAVARVPVIAGGNGRLIDFSLEIKRFARRAGRATSLVTARCPGDHLTAAVTALLRSESGTPGAAANTVVKGATALPCF